MLKRAAHNHQRDTLRPPLTECKVRLPQHGGCFRTLTSGYKCPLVRSDHTPHTAFCVHHLINILRTRCAGGINTRRLLPSLCYGPPLLAHAGSPSSWASLYHAGPSNNPAGMQPVKSLPTMRTLCRFGRSPATAVADPTTRCPAATGW